jgi:hypothetical protein
MPWVIYNYRDHRGRNPVAEWCRKKLQKKDLAKMNHRIDLLGKSGHELCPGLASNLHGAPHLHKIRINGDVAPRLILCKGPINMAAEYTLLLGEFERDDKLPEGTLELAESYRQDIIKDPKNRRGLHERVKR